MQKANTFVDMNLSHISQMMVFAYPHRSSEQQARDRLNTLNCGRSPEISFMNRKSCAAIASFASMLSLANLALADDDDYPSWRPNNTAATSITGPIIVLPNRLHAGNTDFPLRLDSLVSAFKPGQDSIPARIYAVTASTNPSLLNGNKMCGDTAPTWIVVVPQPPTGLEVDAFNSPDKPSSPDSPGLCKTFSYIR